jgi:hypothetical protein
VIQQDAPAEASGGVDVHRKHLAHARLQRGGHHAAALPPQLVCYAVGLRAGGKGGVEGGRGGAEYVRVRVWPRAHTRMPPGPPAMLQSAAPTGPDPDPTGHTRTWIA